MLPARAVVAVPTALAGSGDVDNLGEIPPDCGAVHKDYTDPSCTAQTRNGTCLTCTNRSGHGWFLSRERSRLF